MLNNPLSFTDPFGLDCAYLTDSGKGVESVDQGGSSGECGKTGGYRVQEGITDAQINSEAGTVNLTGTTNGTDNTKRFARWFVICGGVGVLVAVALYTHALRSVISNSSPNGKLRPCRSSRNHDQAPHSRSPRNPYKTKFVPNTIPRRNSLLPSVVGSASPSIIAGARTSMTLGSIPALRVIHIDPMTRTTEWGLRSMQDDPDSDSWGGQNVFDVYTKSQGSALDGTKYKDW
jgi:hypothetical protein